MSTIFAKGKHALQTIRKTIRTRYSAHPRRWQLALAGGTIVIVVGSSLTGYLLWHRHRVTSTSQP